MATLARKERERERRQAGWSAQQEQYFCIVKYVAPCSDITDNFATLQSIQNTFKQAKAASHLWREQKKKKKMCEETDNNNNNKQAEDAKNTAVDPALYVRYSANTTPNDGPILTLKEALGQPQKHRVPTVVATQPMRNMTANESHPLGLPMQFRASWQLQDRPRRIALLLDDCQEEYRDFAADILPNLVRLTEAFRSKQESHCCPIVWSSWNRRWEDGICNAMDRWYGCKGLNLDNYQNACYIADGAAGLAPLREIAPTVRELKDGWFYHSRHLDMFWSFVTEDGHKSYLDEKLKEHGIDTVVIAGLWTDECILATAFAGLSRGYDVVVVQDAVATATNSGDAALTVMAGTSSLVVTTQTVVDYLQNDEQFVLGEPGAVKGVKHPDGRKDDD